MTIFDKIVMSQVEPSPNDLWMRDAVENIKNEDGSTTRKHLGKSLWWFTPQGWKKLFDFDTRYSFKYDYSYGVSDLPINSESSYNPEHGITAVDNTFYLYDGSRALKNSGNLVTEKGMKKHVDNLQGQIDSIKNELEFTNQRIDTLESRLGAMSDDIATLIDGITQQQEMLSNIQSRLAELENRE